MDDLECRVFSGENEVNLDLNSRFVIPHKLRDVIQARNPSKKSRPALWFVNAERNSRPYLACFDNEGFREKWLEIPGALVECYHPDAQWRVTIVVRQREHAQLKPGESIIIVGSPKMTHFEIWNKENYQAGYGPLNPLVFEQHAQNNNTG